jgi:hypothetical protein
MLRHPDLLPDLLHAYSTRMQQTHAWHAHLSVKAAWRLLRKSTQGFLIVPQRLDRLFPMPSQSRSIHTQYNPGARLIFRSTARSFSVDLLRYIARRCSIDLLLDCWSAP